MDIIDKINKDDFNNITSDGILDILMKKEKYNVEINEIISLQIITELFEDLNGASSETFNDFWFCPTYSDSEEIDGCIVTFEYYFDFTLGEINEDEDDRSEEVNYTLSVSYDLSDLTTTILLYEQPC